MSEPKQSFLGSIPTTIKAIAGVITIVGGTLGIMSQLGMLDSDSKKENNVAHYSSSIDQSLIVRSERAYFYDEPDVKTKRKTYLVKGDKIKVLETKGEFVYASFTNSRGVITNGWLLKVDFH